MAKLEVGASFQRSFTVTVEARGEFRHVVTSSADTKDPEPNNNNGTRSDGFVVTDVSAVADLIVTQTGPSTAVPGETISYTLTVTNDGPSVAPSAVIRDVLGVEVVAVEISDGGTLVADTAVWPAIASFFSQESREFTLTIEAPTTGPVLARGRAVSEAEDPRPGNSDGSAADSRVNTIITFDPLDTLQGETSGDGFGQHMANLGDIDGDGVDDFLVAAPGHDAGADDAGRVYVYSGAARTLLFTKDGTAAQERLGLHADRVPDVDGDGVNDMVVGGPLAGAGHASVFSGATGDLIVRLDGSVQGEGFGFRVAGLADADGDGVGDVLVTAPNNSVAGRQFGRAFLYSGADWSLLRTIDGTVEDGAFGSAAAGLADIDGDGLSDIAIGAENSGPGGAGQIRVYSGATGDLLFTADADATGAGLGRTWISAVGDVDGDDVADLYAADVQNTAEGPDTGRGYIISGADGGTLHVFSGKTAGDLFGPGRAMPDIDGDGIRDVVIGARGDDDGAQQAGEAVAFSGATGEPLRTMTSLQAGQGFGFDAVGLGDLNGDGAPDFLVSAGLAGGEPGHVVVVAGVPRP